MTELERTLGLARMEILQLRRENELLRAKVEMIDLFSCVLQTSPHRGSTGMTEDVAWMLDKELTKLKAPPPSEGGGA